MLNTLQLPAEWSTMKKLIWLRGMPVNQWGSETLSLTAFAAPTQKTVTKKSKVTSCEVSFTPSQDLHGYDSPWPAGGGVNKLKQDFEVGGISSQTGGDVAQTNTLRGIGYNRVTAGESYYLKGTAYLFYYTDADSSAYSGNSGGFISNTIVTIPSGKNYVRVQLPNSYGTTYNYDVALNNPSTITSWSPYSNLCPISGWTGAEVTVAGKNLLNESVKTQYATYVYFNSTGDTSEKTMTLPAGTYTISVTYTGSVKAHINVFRMNPYERIAVAYSATSLTFTLTKTEDILLWMQNTGFSIQDIGTVQLEPGSSASTYTTYRAPSTSSVTFPSTQYGGTADVVLGSGSGAYAEVDLGTLTWTSVTADGRFNSTNFTSGAKIPQNATTAPNNNCYSYQQITQQSWYNTNQIGITICGNGYGGAGAIGVSDPAMVGKTNDEIKTALSGVKLVYELATPTPYTFTPASEQLTLAKGDNYAWAEMTND